MNRKLDDKHLPVTVILGLLHRWLLLLGLLSLALVLSTCGSVLSVWIWDILAASGIATAATSVASRASRLLILAKSISRALLDVVKYGLSVRQYLTHFVHINLLVTNRRGFFFLWLLFELLLFRLQLAFNFS